MNVSPEQSLASAKTNQEYFLIAVKNLCLELFEIAVNDEQPRIDSTRKILQFTFGNWLSDKRHELRKNNDIFTGDYSINYEKGIITLKEALALEDWTEGSYYFAYMTDTQILNMVEQAIAEFNAVTPVTIFQSKFIPDYYRGVAVIGACCYILRRVLLSSINQEVAIVWGENEKGKEMVGTLQNLLTSYNDMYEKLKAEKKVKLPKSVMLVSPEYNLPNSKSRYVKAMFGLV